MRNIVHYRAEQGFTAANGYCLFQDRKGYLWIGTENGLMRFNGHSFKAFTTRDGLPDNDILFVDEDRAGRLWLLPFAGRVCYIRNDKVYHPGNTELLRRIRFRSRAISGVSDREGNMWLLSDDQVVKVSPEDSLQIIPLGPSRTKIESLSLWLDAKGAVCLDCDGSYYRWDGRKFRPANDIPLRGLAGIRDSSVLFQPDSGKLWYHGQVFAPGPLSHVNSCFRTRSGELLLATNTGGIVLDLVKGIYTDSFFSSKRAGAFIQAKDGSYWIGTIGDGIVHIKSTAIQKIGVNTADAFVCFIKATPQGMYAASDNATYLEAMQDERGRFRLASTSFYAVSRYSRPVFVGRDRSGNMIYSGNETGWRTWPDAPDFKTLAGHAKSCWEEHDSLLLVGTNSGLFRFHRDRGVVLDTILHHTRVVALAKSGTTIYAGTLNGLLACAPGSPPRVVCKDTTLLQDHITALCPGRDDVLWVANSRAELVALKGERIAAVAGLKEGLQCNRISCLKTSGDLLWIGTDNGLYAVANSLPLRIVKHITYASGLNSNQVNCLDVYRGRVWVGTVNGINYFDEVSVLQGGARPALIINSVSNGDRILQPQDEMLSLEQQTLTIDYDVVDYTTSSRPVFQYRLHDEDPWTFMEGDHLFFPSLPYGKFVLSIRALTPGKPEGVSFRQVFFNPFPFYRQGWFIALALASAAMLIALIAYLFVKRTRRRDTRMLRQQQNLLQLEQMALQARMNPHFIFNCMASVKHLYSTGDIARAEHFVDEFSLLIRQTFEMGDAVFTGMDKELSYLERYLNVERERFGRSFTFSFEIAPGLSLKELPVPVMLLQPVVENAIRHGIRHLSGNTGHITIAVRQEDNHVVIVIADNGPGYKITSGSGRDAMLTSSVVNTRRIKILNHLFEGQIAMRMENRADGLVGQTGVEVTITYPVNLNQQTRL